MRASAITCLLFAAVCTSPGTAAALTIDFVAVGDPGNANDTDRPTCGFNNNLPCGSVGYNYVISKYEVTNAQYASFLNATSLADPNGLYDTNMNSSAHGGIVRSGVSGSFSYSVKSGFANKPVNFVTFYDALRFANWLHNGQPIGAQGASTTEGGAYTITLAGISSNTIARNLAATFFVPSEHEWYKAGYYSTVTDAYFDYPAGSDAIMVCSAPTATFNRANCIGGVGTVTDVGSYTGSASPNGTFDQGGNVEEWTDDLKTNGLRRYRGSHFNQSAGITQGGNHTGSFLGGTSEAFVGFRVAAIPEPGTSLLVAMGLLGLAVGRPRRS